MRNSGGVSAGSDETSPSERGFTGTPPKSASKIRPCSRHARGHRRAASERLGRSLARAATKADFEPFTARIAQRSARAEQHGNLRTNFGPRMLCDEWQCVEEVPHDLGLNFRECGDHDFDRRVTKGQTQDLDPNGVESPTRSFHRDRRKHRIVRGNERDDSRFTQLSIGGHECRERRCHENRIARHRHNSVEFGSSAHRSQRANGSYANARVFVRERKRK